MHAPRYKIKFQGHLLFYRQNICFIRKGLPLSGYQRLFYSHRKQNTSFAMSTEIDKGETIHSHKFDEEILFQSSTLFQSRTGVQTSHIFSRKPTLYLKFSYRGKPGCMPPGFQSYPSELLVLIGRTN